MNVPEVVAEASCAAALGERNAVAARHVAAAARMAGYTLDAERCLTGEPERIGVEKRSHRQTSSRRLPRYPTNPEDS